MLINSGAQGLKRQYSVEMSKFQLPNFHFVLPNATKHNSTTKLDKRILQSNAEQEVWRLSEELQGFKWITDIKLTILTELNGFDQLFCLSS